MMIDAPDIRFFKDRKGLNIAYARSGSGPLVICPAWWVSHVEADWSQPAFRSFFEALSRNLSLVRYDRAGVGLSDKQTPPRTLQDEVDLLDDLVGELGADTYSLFAISCAGPVAINHAADYPNRVEKLCFYGSYADGARICPRDVQEAVHGAVKAHWGLGARAMADIFLPDADRGALNAFAKQQRDAADVETAAQLLKLTYEMDAADRLGDVTAEALILHRRGDRAVPFESARALAKGIRNARLATLEGRSHLPWIGGEEIAQIANAFFAGTDPSTHHAIGAEPTPPRLDIKNRCLALPGRSIALTPLEFGVMVELTTRRNEVVTRDHLLETVWKQPFEGSNRIDALIRGLRRKLDDYAPSIETVKGHGYRFSDWKRTE